MLSRARLLALGAGAAVLASSLTAVTALSALAAAEPVVVTPAGIVAADDMSSGTAESDTCALPSDQAWCEIQRGRGKAGIVADSERGEVLELDTPDSAALARVALRPAEPLQLADVTDLGYSTLVRRAGTASAQQAPALVVVIETPDALPDNQVTLVWEPLSSGTAVVPGSWQTWTPSSGPGWHVSGAGDGSQTLEDLQAVYPHSLVTAVGINQGSGNAGLLASADLLVVNGTTYDFALPAASRYVVLPRNTSWAPCVQAWCISDTATAGIALVDDDHAGQTVLELTTPDDAAEVRLANHSADVKGKDIAQVGTLQYDTFVDVPSGREPALEPGMKIVVSHPTDPAAGVLPSGTPLDEQRSFEQVTLIWEPIYTAAERAAVVDGVWQRWTPSTEYGWWSPQNRSSADPTRQAGHNEVGTLGFPQETATWAQVQDALAGSAVQEIGVGQGDTAAGLVTRVDEIRVDGRRYDFEPEPAPSPSPSTTPSASATPTASASASPSPSLSASPTASAVASSASPANDSSPTPSSTEDTSGQPTAEPSGGSGSITTQSTQDNSASSSPTAAAPARCPLAQVHVDTPTINATGVASVTVLGAAPGAAVELFGYSQNHRGTATFGSAPVRTAKADENGAVTFTDLRPSANTRLKARQVGCGFGASKVLSVRTQLILTVRRTGTRTYVFSGDSIPAREGGLIVGIYRVTASGETLVSQARADAVNGEWTRTLTFPVRDANARAQFVVKTGQDAQNVPGRSNVRSLLVF